MRIIFLTIYLLGISHFTHAAVREKTGVFYSRNIEKFKLSLNLPIVDHEVELTLPEDQIAVRLRSSDSSIVEPLQILVPKNSKQLAKVLSDLCLRNCVQLTKKLQISIKKDLSTEKIISISLTPELFSYLNKQKYLEQTRKKHHRLVVQADDLNVPQKSELLRQAQLFLTPQETGSLRIQLAKNSTLDVDRYLLPRFAANVISHFTKYKGPNCFQAALAFQNINLAKSESVNVREEKGYHPAMINYDELWRILEGNFREINPKKTALEFGDMVVIMDVTKDQQTRPVDFKNIRHAATYLFNGYVFSKGSKSASSPYLIKPLADEFKLWKSFTPNIAVKVYRNNFTKQAVATKFLDDWLDQT